MIVDGVIFWYDNAMELLPIFLKKLFWDVDFKTLNKDEYEQFIIARILEYGDKRAMDWMKNNFEIEKVKNVVCSSPELSLKSVTFWQLILNLKKDKILCLKKLSRGKQGLIWRH